MSIEQFWALIQTVHNASEGDMVKKCELMSIKLKEMPSEARQAFESHFDAAMKALYEEPSHLWQVCHQLGGFCGDDAFNDFCAALISRGKSEYTKALAEPEFLLENNIYPTDMLFFESFAYIFHDQ